MSKVRITDGFQFEMSKTEAEEKFYGDEADVFGKPKPKGMWEALFVAPVLDEEARKEYLANHCECPLVRKLLQDSMKESDKNE